MKKTSLMIYLIVMVLLSNIVYAAIKSNDSMEEGKTLEEGTYIFLSVIHKNIAWDITDGSDQNSAQIQLWENLYANQQKFNIIYASDGYYKIQSVKTKKYLTVDGSAWGAKIVQEDEKNDDTQLWCFPKQENGSYNIQSKCGMNVDVPDWNCQNGIKLQAWDCHGDRTAQQFIFQKEGPAKGEKVLESGDYRILLKMNVLQSFDIDCGLQTNGAKAQLWQDMSKLQQKFILQYEKNGYYKIISKNSGKALTITSTDTRLGTTIVQQEDQNLDTQLWTMQEVNPSCYQFRSKVGNMSLSVENGNNGTPLVLGDREVSKHNTFILVDENIGEKADTSLPDGYYNITLPNAKVVDVNGAGYANGVNIQIWDRGDVQQQKFHITRVPNENYYKMTAMHSAKCMQVQYGVPFIGANVEQGDNAEQDGQYWYLINCGDGYFQIVSKLNQLYLQTQNASQNGANIELGYAKQVTQQKFSFQLVNAVEYGPFEIETKLSQDRVLDVDCGSYADGANVQIWDPQNKNQERFVVEPYSNQYYVIRNLNSKKVLTVEESGNVAQYSYDGGDHQLWMILERGEHYYSFVSKKNGYCLDVNDASTANGTNVKTWWDNGNNAQRFRLVPGYRKFDQQGIYGTSGKRQANWGGYDLPYEKIGQGSQHLFMTFSIHGFEDSYDHDGAELTYMADQLRDYLRNHMTEDMVNQWTIYIFPNLNPDGQYDGWTNNGPGRTTLYSWAPNHKGIDMNRCWSVGYSSIRKGRNYTGTEPFQAPEASELRDFILNHQGSRNLVIDVHGWLNETIGDNGLGGYFRDEFGISKHIWTYGNGYLINWAISLANTRAMLLELPEVQNHTQVVNRDYAGKLIRATLKMLEEV